MRCFKNWAIYGSRNSGILNSSKEELNWQVWLTVLGKAKKKSCQLKSMKYLSFSWCNRCWWEDTRSRRHQFVRPAAHVATSPNTPPRKQQQSNKQVELFLATTLRRAERRETEQISQLWLGSQSFMLTKRTSIRNLTPNKWQFPLESVVWVVVLLKEVVL